MSTADRRYVAECIERQYKDERGEWDPDRDDYRAMDCTSLEDAKAKAIQFGKQANAAEWARVTVEEFDPELGIPRRSSAAWDVVEAWIGDWDGNWENVS